MKQYILKLICLTFCFFASMNVMAQQTSLIVDNQTPGWLSSKIGFGDQQTVENLKVTGYINGADLEFISGLASNYSLNKRLDLEDTYIVGETPDKDNYLVNNRNIFGNGGGSNVVFDTLYFQFFSYPKTLKEGDARALNRLSVDTLFINTTTGFTKALLAKVKHIKIGENVTVIKYPSFNDASPYPEASIESIEFPSTLKEIRETWNSSQSYNSISLKINNGKNLREFPSLERLVAGFLINEMSDSVFLPNIEVLSLNQYHDYSSKRMFKSGMHVFIGEKIKKITDMSHAQNIHLHFASPIPPVMEGSITYHYQLENQSYYVLHVPMGSAAAYRACFKDGGTKVTIIEEIVEVTDVELDKHEMSLNVGDTYGFSVVVSPEKATDKSVNWVSNNSDVATINDVGVVTAKKSGKANIIASSVTNPEIKDTCEVTVTQPVEALTLEKHSISLYVGETENLYPQFYPPTADNKSILWSSSNEQIATVDAAGSVKALSGGEAWIKAVSNDNPEAKDSCKVNVSYQSYTLIYILEGEIYQILSVVYGTTLSPPDVPTKEGYTFSGWKNLPETMPNHDVVVTGSYTINSYTLTYIIGGEEYKTSTVVYGSAITPEAEPTKEGYTFSGWGEIPDTMPAEDVVVTGSFIPNSYTLLYIVDGEEYKSSSVTFGTALVPEEEPTKEGYTFSGWSEIPETMPAEDVTVTGSFTINQYLLTYIIDGEEYKSYEVDFNTTLTPEAAPAKKGMTFSGWSEMPETMPAHDVILTGTYNWSKETVDGVVYQVADTLNNYASIVGYEGTEGEAELLSDIEIGEDVYEVYSIAEDALPKTLTIRTSIGRLLLWLWTNDYTNIKETETDRDLSAPEMSLVAKTASSLKLSFANDYPELTETVTVSGTAVEKGENGYDVALRGLEPDYLYEELATVTLSFEDASYTKAYSFRTEPLTLTALQPKVVSLGNVIVTAESNLDDEETNVGFEWRRVDWTDEFESRTGAAYLYEGIMEGYIRSLNADRLWKFRPYYTSDAGNTYYCDWKGMDPSDYSFFEPTVHTYEPIAVTDSTAEVKGYAMRGTDDVTSQGFVYWQNTPSSSSRRNAKGVPEDATIVEVSGHVMKATLSDLEYDTEYCFAAFVKTESGETFYGEQQSFKTNSDPDGIKDLKDSKNPKDLNDLNADWYDLSGRKIMNGQSSNRKLPRGIYINGGRKVVVK